MAGYFNAGMSWEEDFLEKGVGTVADGTWYTATDYSGAGRLFAVGWYQPTTVTGELKITSDGTASTWAKTSNDKRLLFNETANADYYRLPFCLDFEASLKVEGRRDGDTNLFYLQTLYGIYSEEFKREIITAGASLPGRNYTYPFDVMLIWFKGSHGISNKVQFLPPPNVDITYDKSGIPTGKYKEASYSLTVNGPRAVWEQKSVTKTIPLMIDGVKYDASIENGVLVADGLPTKAGK